MDGFVPRHDGSAVIASEARQSMCLRRQSMDGFVPRHDGSAVIASEARQSMCLRRQSMVASCLAMMRMGHGERSAAMYGWLRASP